MWYDKDLFEKNLLKRTIVIHPDECFTDRGCKPGDVCALIHGGEYWGGKKFNTDEQVNRCIADDKCGKYWCGEYTATISDIKGNMVDMQVTCDRSNAENKAVTLGVICACCCMLASGILSIFEEKEGGSKEKLLI